MICSRLSLATGYKALAVLSCVSVVEDGHEDYSVHKAKCAS